MSPATTAGAPGARGQMTRLLTLVPYLHSRGTVSVAEAAEALGTTPDQVVRDLRVLFMCGLPGGYPDDLIDVDLDAVETDTGQARADGLVKISNADYLTRPLRLTATEASAVIVALRALRASAEPDTAAIVDQALAKLVGAASASAADTAQVVEVEASSDPGGRAEAQRLRELEADARQAVADGVQLEIDYYNPARDEQSVRTVDPHAVVTDGSTGYLDAWCHAAGGPRLFRLDRVGAWRVLGTPVTTQALAPRDLSSGLVPAQEATRTTLLLQPAARWVTEYYPVVAVRPADTVTPGAVEVDLLVADDRWLTRLLLRLAPNAHVMDPQEQQTKLSAAAQAALALYS